MSKRLHIISFDNPYPPNYGGVIDVFYKLKSLKQAGVKITLHIFEYGRVAAAELENYCEEVIYYKRRTFVNPFIGTLPYIVSTRNDHQLLKNLLKDDAPILFEGLHTCHFLNHPDLKNRKKMVRMHNIEHDYYRKLEEVESNFFKKYFFSKEAERLQQYESILHYANIIWAISPNDFNTLKSRYKHVQLLPAFHANEQISSKTGIGKFAFYHGNLSVGENDEAARFLVNKVFNDLDVPLIIAGNNPSEALKNAVANYAHISLQQNISTEQINTLTAEAQLNVLPTFQGTGIKLKLLNVLFQGRWVIANQTMVENTGLESLCRIANFPEEFKQAVSELMKQQFNDIQKENRSQVLNREFSNAENIKKLIQAI
jgi:hypothetical protein